MSGLEVMMSRWHGMVAIRARDAGANRSARAVEEWTMSLGRRPRLPRRHGVEPAARLRGASRYVRLPVTTSGRDARAWTWLVQPAGLAFDPHAGGPPIRP
jgi:hypothetical protein